MIKVYLINVLICVDFYLIVNDIVQVFLEVQGQLLSEVSILEICFYTIE